MTEDTAFATGCVEVMFTLRGNPWQTKTNNTYKETSAVELWGQILQPLAFRAPGYSEVFGIRFYPATAAFLVEDDISVFNDGVFDLASIAGNSINDLHEKVQDAKSVSERIELVESFLVKKLSERPKAVSKIILVRQVMDELAQHDFFDNIDNVASRYGITSRYLRKIFLQHTGLTPKLYAKINRFQNSLVMMGRKDNSLTSIAYESGYYDQSHFIRDFKSFTGFSPSGFDTANTTAILASPNK